MEWGFELVYHKKYMDFLSWITELPQGDAVPAQQDQASRIRAYTDQGFWFRSKGGKGVASYALRQQCSDGMGKYTALPP